MSDLLFVYGTLRSASGHPIQAVLAAAGTCVGAASTPGQLYRIDWYPGLVVGEGDVGLVHGDLWTVNDRPALTVLDEYEGSDYERRMVSVTLDTGAVMRAFAFVYTGPIEGLDVVTSGDWLAQ